MQERKLCYYVPFISLALSHFAGHLQIFAQVPTHFVELDPEKATDTILACIIRGPNVTDATNVEIYWTLPNNEEVTEARPYQLRFTAGLFPIRHRGRNSTSESNLLIKDVTLADAGTYTCGVRETDRGSDLSAEVELEVTGNLLSMRWGN